MKEHFLKKSKINLLILTLLIFNATAFSQEGLTLEQSLNVAEINSPSMQKTRLNLIRNEENLNAQNASLKSQFSLTLNPLEYTQTQGFQ